VVRPRRKAGMDDQAVANLSALIESTEDLIWSVDLDHRLIAFNRALRQTIENTYGVTVAVGKRIEDMISPERAKLWPPFYKRALSKGSFRTVYSLMDGRTLELAFNPIIVDGKTTGTSVFGKDITEREVAETALQEAERKYREIFDGALEGMFQTSPEGRLICANAYLARMLGYDSPAELMSFVEYVAQDVWENPDERLRMLRQVEEQGAIRNFEYRVKRKDKTIIWASLSAHKVCDADGRMLYLEGFTEDITERMLATKARAESEARFRTFFEENGSVMTLIDPTSGEIVDANHAASAFYGYPQERLVGMNLNQVYTMPPEELALELQQPLTKDHNVFTYRTRLASGEERDIEVYSTLFVLDGRLLRHGIVHDVTERKRAEKAQRESEERYRATFEQAAVGVVHTSFDGRILRCNARFAEIVGYPIEEIPCLTFQQITAPEEQASTDAMIAQLVSGAGGSVTWEKRYLRKNGSRTWARATVSLYHDAEGRPLHFIALVEDISARKEAEERLVKAADALRNSEERYRTVFQTSPDAININRIVDGRFIDCNQAFLDMSGYKREEIIGRTSLEVGIWADARDRQTMMNMLRQNSRVCGLEVQLRKKDGEIGWGQLSASTIELDGVPCILTVVRNITEAKAAAERLAAAQEALQDSELRYRTAFQTSPDFVDINRLDDGTYIDANEAYLDILGFAREEVIGRTPSELNIWADPGDRQKFVEMLRQNSKCRNLEAQFQKKDGTLLWGLVSASVIELDGVPCVLSVVRDLSDVKAAQDEINNLSFYDPLTRLPNRRLLMDRLLRSPLSASRSRRKRALLFVDLDNFKSLNDALGHQTGDLLLQEAALRLDSCVRESDTVARCGGDEFAVMLENLSEVAENAAAQAQIIGKKILAICGLPYMLAGHECHCPSSIGITVFGGKPENANEALQRAEIAMFQAKEAGRNTIRFFSPDLQAAVSARAAMEEDLREAIKTNQFELYYQPQVERSRLIGAEALIRWKHPRHGLLAPGEFIPLAEESGLILLLGDWVLEAACAQLAAWAVRKETAAITLAVNISARQFRQPDFVDRVLSVLDRTGANSLTLKLELTESILLDNVDDVIAKMKVLKSHGLRFSLDDFGTGYSSMAYLRRLPLDELKIDLIFVRDILADAASGAIAQAILSLGKAMGLRVIAEGVESEEQRKFLIRMGCHSFQGFLFSRPLPLEEFQLWLPESTESAAPAPKKARRSSSTA
jgi:diguanylate cyclase (GGDEF)-like protein/PAS domain S-box-containing protein